MPDMSRIRCFYCKQAGHMQRNCPDLPPSVDPIGRAASYEEHLARIDNYVNLYIEGTLTAWQKRVAIAAESLQWYGHPVTRNGVSLTSP